MAGRIESEKKKTAFIEACENMNSLKVIPEKLLQAQMLMDTLRMDEIDMTMLYKCGCPCDWVKDAIRQCQLKKGKRIPKYSNECAACWLYNLTDEVAVNEQETDIHEIIRVYHQYKDLGLEPSQIDAVLTYLGWKEIYDYGLFLDTVKDMREAYINSK